MPRAYLDRPSHQLLRRYMDIHVAAHLDNQAAVGLLLRTETGGFTRAQCARTFFYVRSSNSRERCESGGDDLPRNSVDAVLGDEVGALNGAQFTDPSLA